MKRFMLFVLAVALVMTAAVCAQAATEVQMTGDALVYGNYFSNRNFTGWNRAAWVNNAGVVQAAGTRAADEFEIWERFRLRTDFVTNEAVKFRFGVMVEDTWGHGTLTAANPQPAIEPYLAYLQFKWPDTNIEITAGYQPFSVPHTEAFYDSIVLAADDGDQVGQPHVGDQAGHVPVMCAGCGPAQGAGQHVLDHRGVASPQPGHGEAEAGAQLRLQHRLAGEFAAGGDDHLGDADGAGAPGEVGALDGQGLEAQAPGDFRQILRGGGQFHQQLVIRAQHGLGVGAEDFGAEAGRA